MSGAPKKLNEEDGQPTSTKRPLEDTSAVHALGPSGISEYQPAVNESGADGRLAKVPRIEPRDVDKRLPSFPVQRMPSSSSNDSRPDHLATSENRMESRDRKDDRDTKVENKDAKVEVRELHTEARVDPLCVKGEKPIRVESRVDDSSSSKETKHDRVAPMVPKDDIKIVNDGFTAGNSRLNWKDPKENLDQLRSTQNNSSITNESCKEASTTEGRDCSEAREAVGENKVDVKGDDVFKEKEKKRRDEKHKDWGERGKDKNDRRNIQQLGSNGSERRESTREERESERWERDRKDLQKEKERPKEMEKDHIKKEIPNGPEKENAHNERELVDGSVRMMEQENVALENRRNKDVDSWKAADKDSQDRKRERDVDVEGDRREKNSRCYERESDVEGDIGGEREREVFGPGVHRKRGLRPRGSPLTNREPRFRSRTRDNEESPGLPTYPLLQFLVEMILCTSSTNCNTVQNKPEVSTVVYKVGECMQELLKLWKEFEASQENKNDETSLGGPTLEIRIPAEYVTATNRQVRGGQLWGTDTYTDDSDLVAVLMHTGYCRPTASPPPPAIQELRATVRVLPPLDCYISTLRNNVRSRAWGAAIGCSYRVERCCIVKKGGGTIDLEPCLTHTSSVEPTLAPVAVERTMTTRAAASNALRQQRFVREVTIQYNLCNEPWTKYSISIVADKGLKKPMYTSARLKKGEVLYLETHSNRYELCFNGEKIVSATTSSHLSEIEKEKPQASNVHEQNGERNVTDRETTLVDVFRWSRCKKPLPQKVMQSIGIPLPLEHVEVLEESLDWEDVQWSQTGVWIAGKEYVLSRVHFLSPN